MQQIVRRRKTLTECVVISVHGENSSFIELMEKNRNQGLVVENTDVIIEASSNDDERLLIIEISPQCVGVVKKHFFIDGRGQIDVNSREGNHVNQLYSLSILIQNE